MQPDTLAGIPGDAWTGLLAVGRDTQLLGTLWARTVEAGVEDRLPAWAARHLWGAALTAETNAAALRWELEGLERGLLRRISPVLVLKGGAYLLAGLPNAAGRLAGDIDLLVPRAELERAEEALLYAGWVGTHPDAYDQHYYRQWMHELPPLRHRQRGTVLDLHHNILPETFAVRVDPQRILAAAEPAPGMRGLHVPAPRHMTLHAVVHLLAETDWTRGLRDLYDIHCMLEHFDRCHGPAFWEALLDEAEAMRLAWLLEPAIECCRHRFGTRVPAAAAERLSRHAPARPFRRLGRWVLEHALNGRVSTTPRADALARAAVLVRGHWLKMPPRLLLRHLLHKAFLAPRADRSDRFGGAEPQQHG